MLANQAVCAACHSSQNSFYSSSKAMKVCDSFIDRLYSACSDSFLCPEGKNCLSATDLCRNAADVVGKRFRDAWEVVDGSHPNCFDPIQRLDSNLAGLNSENPNAEGIAIGAVIGGIAVLAVLIGIVFFCERRANTPVKPADTTAPHEVCQEDQPTSIRAELDHRSSNNTTTDGTCSSEEDTQLMVLQMMGRHRQEFITWRKSSRKHLQLLRHTARNKTVGTTGIAAPNY